MNQSHVTRRKFHFIYKTICLITGKYYYGRHSTDDLEDGYLGSGTHFTRSVRKHGKENHVRSIIEQLPDLASLKLREAEIVNQEMLKDEMCMNIALGGCGGWEHIKGRNLTSPAFLEYKNSGRAKLNLIAAGVHYLATTTHEDRRQRNLKTIEANPEAFKAWSNAGRLIAAAPEANEKRKATFKQIGHMQGDKNSQYGSCWILKAEISKKIKKDELEFYLVEGWVRGRKMTPIT